MIAKIIVYGEDRETAIKKMLFALGETVVEGIKTNITLHKKLLSHNKFLDNLIFKRSRRNKICW